MKYTKAFLRAIWRRMQPGVWINPNKVIGTCQYCDEEVTHAKGDLDAAGRPRHDKCVWAVLKRQTSPMLAEAGFRQALRLMRELPSVRKRLAAAVWALPKNYGPEEMAGLISEMIAYVETDRELSLQTRRDTVVALKRFKQEILGLAPFCRAA